MQDMVDKRFGKLEIVEYEKRKPNALSRCTCKCDCGKTIEIGLAALRMIIPGLFEPPVRILRATVPENGSQS